MSQSHGIRTEHDLNALKKKIGKAAIRDMRKKTPWAEGIALLGEFLAAMNMGFTFEGADTGVSMGRSYAATMIRGDLTFDLHIWDVNRIVIFTSAPLEICKTRLLTDYDGKTTAIVHRSPLSASRKIKMSDETSNPFVVHITCIKGSYNPTAVGDRYIELPEEIEDKAEFLAYQSLLAIAEMVRLYEADALNDDNVNKCLQNSRTLDNKALDDIVDV